MWYMCAVCRCYAFDCILTMEKVEIRKDYKECELKVEGK